MQSFYKQTGETKTVTIDFSPVLDTAELINSSNVTVSAIEIDTGNTVTSTVVDVASVSVIDSGKSVLFRITSGSSNSVYKVTCNTGLTNGSNVHEEDIVIIVSDDINLLFTVDELKSNLGITDNTKDPLLFGLVREATDWVSKACSRNFTFNSYVETFYFDEKTDMLLLNNFPVDSVTSIVVDGITLDEIGTDTLAQWTFTDDGCINRVDGGYFPKKPHNTVVTYKAGFQVIPEDIRMAVKKIAIYEYQRRLREGILAETIGNYRIVYNRESLADDGVLREIISRYRKRMF